jgi:hypothetical protein
VHRIKYDDAVPSSTRDGAGPLLRLFYESLIGEPVKELEGMVRHVEESGADRLALAYMQKAQPATTPEHLD